MSEALPMSPEGQKSTLCGNQYWMDESGLYTCAIGDGRSCEKPADHLDGCGPLIDAPLTYEELEEERDRLALELYEANQKIERLRGHILDIDAHATPLGSDDDGFVATGYAISVGCLHRALGAING